MLLFRSDFEPAAWEWRHKWRKDKVTRRRGRQYFGAYAPRGPADPKNTIVCTMPACRVVVDDSVMSGNTVIFASQGETERRFVCKDCIAKLEAAHSTDVNQLYAQAKSK